MPLQVGANFVKFVYKYQEIIDKYPQLEVPEKCWQIHPNIVRSEIVLDGGNCVRHGDKAIITDIIFRHNKDFKKKDLLANLESLLESQVIIVPHEPYDPLSHADGIAKWIDDKTVFVEDFDDKRYLDRLLTALGKHNLEVVLFPLAYDQAPKMSAREFRKLYPEGDTWNCGYGYYINYLQTKGLILCPQFGIEEDRKVIAMLKKYFPDNFVEGIECTGLSMEGGLIHCVTMAYQME